MELLDYQASLDCVESRAGVHEKYLDVIGLVSLDAEEECVTGRLQRPPFPS